MCSAIASDEVAAGRRRVAHRGDRTEPADPEVVDQRAVAVDRLGADAGRSAYDVARCAARGDRPAPSSTYARFDSEPCISRSPARQCWRNSLRGPRPPQRPPELAEVDVAPPVALARGRQHRVGPDVDGAVDARREVHAEERVRRVRAPGRPGRGPGRARSATSRKYSPRNGTIAGEASSPAAVATRSDWRPAQSDRPGSARYSPARRRHHRSVGASADPGHRPHRAAPARPRPRCPRPWREPRAR